MRTPISAILICMILITGPAFAEPPLMQPLLDKSVVQNPATENIARQLRPWLKMEINDFRTLWNGRPIFTYTLSNKSSEPSSQLEMRTSFAKNQNGPWGDTDIISHMSMAPGTSRGPILQIIPRGTKWIKVEIRQDLKPGKPVVCAKTFAANFAGPIIENVLVKASKDKTGTTLQTTIRNPTVENFRDDCSIKYLFSDSPKMPAMSAATAQPLQIPAQTTITHSLPMPPDASKTHLTIVIQGLLDTIATRHFKKVGRLFVPMGK